MASGIEGREGGSASQTTVLAGTSSVDVYNSVMEVVYVKQLTFDRPSD